MSSNAKDHQQGPDDSDGVHCAEQVAYSLCCGHVLPNLKLGCRKSAQVVLVHDLFNCTRVPRASFLRARVPGLNRSNRPGGVDGAFCSRL